MTILDATAPPRFGGVLWRIARRTTRLAMPTAGRRWNPIFAVVIHRGRRTGREWATPVAARRVSDGFVVSLAFGAQADWHRNLVAAGGGVIRWRGIDHPVQTPQPIDRDTALPAFNRVQRVALRAAGVRGFIRLPDRSAGTQ